MTIKATNFEVARDYDGTIRPGGTRPVKATVTFEVPGGYGPDRFSITLDKYRLEAVLDTMQTLALEQLTSTTTREDDKLIGAADVMTEAEAVSAEVEELKKQLAAERDTTTQLRARMAVEGITPA